MDALNDPRARRPPAPEPRYFVDEEEAERISVWANEVSDDGYDEQTIDDNASQYRGSEGPAVNAFQVLQHAGHILDLESRAETATTRSYIVIPADTSEAGDFADLERIPQHIQGQAAHHDRSQASNRPSEEPREQQQHPDILAPLLPGRSQQSAPPPTLPPIGPFLDEAQRPGRRAASRLSWNQEPYAPQSPRLYEYVYRNQPPERPGQDQQPQLVQQRPYEFRYHPPEQFQHLQPLTARQYQSYWDPVPPQQCRCEHHRHHQQPEQYQQHQPPQLGRQYHNYQEPGSPQHDRYEHMHQRPYRYEQHQHPQPTQQYAHTHSHQQPEQYHQHHHQQQSQPAQQNPYVYNRRQPEQYHQHQQQLQLAQQYPYDRIHQQSELGQQHQQPEPSQLDSPAYNQAHNNVHQAFRNQPYGHSHAPVYEEAQAQAQAPAPDINAMQHNTLAQGHYRPTPPNWVSGSEMAPGHREARMEALELEYHIHELDHRVWQRQCELRRELERQQRR